MILTRRTTLLGGLALGACAQSAPVASEVPAPAPNDPRIAAIEHSIGGRAGVFALNTADGAILVHRASERFAMCSTFKWLLAAQHLRMNDETRGWLDEVAMFGPGDLLDHAPTAREHLAQGGMSNETMCEGAVVLSDNTCANLLLVASGGPAGFTQFLRQRGDSVTRLDRNEPALNVVPPGDERDTTTPEAMVATMQRFLLGETVLSAAAREKLTGWMIESPTGLARLRAGLPTDWRAGDKTGTWNGEHNCTNDVAIAWPPGRAPILIACYLSGSTVEPAARNAAHAEIARVVAEEWG